MTLLAIHTGHDATLSVFHDNQLHNLELERLVRQRYFRFSRTGTAESILQQALRLAQHHFGVPNRFDAGIVSGKSKFAESLRKVVNADSWEHTYQHHYAHATAALYESSFPEALIFSFDGGGPDGVFNMYRGRRGQDLEFLGKTHGNLGTSYRLFSFPIAEIHKVRVPTHACRVDLASAGKLMGLAGYGSARPEWTKRIAEVMRKDTRFYRYKDPATYLKRLGLPCEFNSISGPIAYDFAASAQLAFEEVFLETALPYLNRFQLPVCLTGGAALNVLLNERLKRMISRPVFVPPNPNDCGLTTGLLLDRIRPKEALSVSYSGWPLLDADQHDTLRGERICPAKLARLLAEGKIVGVARSRSEHGPRALGNRSILCDPGKPEMKEVLNAKVKHREWFRPFAPVTKLESVSEYFDTTGASPYMSFAPPVRDQWKTRLPAIVHADGTARVQTVTEQEHPWLYELLGEFQAITGYDVLLNTSFNIKGLPILTTIKDALTILASTQIDCVLIEDTMVGR